MAELTDFQKKNVYNTNTNTRGDNGTESGLIRYLQTFLWNNRCRDYTLPSYVEGSSSSTHCLWSVLRGFLWFDVLADNV